MRTRPSESEPAVVHRTRLAKRIYRDVDSLAAARSEVKSWMQRAHDAEACSRQVDREITDDRQHRVVAQRTLAGQVGELESRLLQVQKLARWRDNERKAAESRALEAEARAEALEEVVAEHKTDSEVAGKKVTAAERNADTLKSRYGHLKDDFRRGAKERSRLDDEVKALRQQVRGACAHLPPPVQRARRLTSLYGLRRSSRYERDSERATERHQRAA